MTSLKQFVTAEVHIPTLRKKLQRTCFKNVLNNTHRFAYVVKKLLQLHLYSIPDMCPTKTATTTNTSSPPHDEESDTSDYSSDTAPYGSSFFEGVEKLLEVWFTTVDGDINNCDLRRIPR